MVSRRIGIVEKLGTISKRIAGATRVAAALVASGRRPRLNSRLLSFGGLRTRSASDFHDCAYVERNRTLLSSLNSPGAFSHNARNLRVHARVLAFSLLIAVPHSVPRDASVSLYPLPRTRKQQEVGSSNKLPSVQCDETRLERSLRDLGQRESFVVPRLPSTSLKTLKG